MQFCLTTFNTRVKPVCPVREANPCQNIPSSTPIVCIWQHAYWHWLKAWQWEMNTRKRLDTCMNPLLYCRIVFLEESMASWPLASLPLPSPGQLLSCSAEKKGRDSTGKTHTCCSNLTNLVYLFVLKKKLTNDCGWKQTVMNFTH